MGPRVDPVRSDENLPERADVVVIGGGIVGTSTALFLAERGVSVALCEKGEIACEQSSRNWGWVRKQGRDPREIPLIIESLRLWEGMNERTGAETGFRTTGILFLAETDAQADEHEKWLEHARLHQMDSRMVDSDEVARLLPGAARKFRSGIYTPSDGRAEPQKAAPAIAEAARQHGAAILTQCAVRGVETAGGRISGVVTERGKIACASVVLAGGAWSRLFCGSLGIRLPQLKVRSTVYRTKPLEGGPEIAATTGKFAFRKRLDGGYTIAGGFTTVHELVPDSFVFFRDFLPALRNEWGSLTLRVGERFVTELRTPRRWALDRPSPFEATRVNDPAPMTALNDQAQQRLAAAFPVFAKAEVAQQWAGLIDVTPDAVPVISPVEGTPGFFVATGFSGHGFGIGPGAGRLMADLVTGAPPIVDPAPFRFSRFTDGTRPRPQAGL